MFGKNRNKGLKIVCPACGKTLSAEAIKKAGDKAKKKLEEAMKKYGTISVKKDWDIKCDSCGKNFVYNPYE